MENISVFEIFWVFCLSTNPNRQKINLVLSCIENCCKLRMELLSRNKLVFKILELLTPESLHLEKVAEVLDLLLTKSDYSEILKSRSLLFSVQVIINLK